MPSLFSDIGKNARDLLTRDFNLDEKLSVSTYTRVGMVLTGDLGAIYESKNTLVDVKVDTASTIATTFTFTDLFPSTKTLASVKLPDYNSSKLEVQYFHDHATFTTAVALKQSSVVDLSVTLGDPIMTFGAKARYKTSISEFKCTAGIGVTTPDNSLSAILGDKGDSLKVSFVTNVSKLKGTTLGVEFHRVLFAGFPTELSRLTIGCSQILDPLTRVKVKLNNVGQIAAVLQHEVIPKSLLTVSTEFDIKTLDRIPKLGLALSLKL